MLTKLAGKSDAGFKMDFYCRYACSYIGNDFFVLFQRVFDWNSSIEINPSFTFNLLVNIAIGLFISFVSFESGVKAEKERISAEDAESKNIQKIIKKLAGDKSEIILSSKSESQLSSLSQEENVKTNLFLNKLQSDFNELMKTQKVVKIKKNTYSYRASPTERIIFSKEGDVFIIHEIINR